MITAAGLPSRADVTTPSAFGVHPSTEGNSPRRLRRYPSIERGIFPNTAYRFPSLEGWREASGWYLLSPP